MNNSKLTVSATRLPASNEYEYRATLSLNDVVHSRYILNDRILMLYKPNREGSIAAEQIGLRSLILRQLEAELQEFVRKEISYKFSELLAHTGATL